MSAEHDKNCKEAIEVMKKCTNKIDWGKCSDAEKEFLEFCIEIAILGKHKTPK